MLLFSTSRVEDRVVPHPCAPVGEFIPGFTGSLVFQIVVWWALADRTQMEESVTQQLSAVISQEQVFLGKPWLCPYLGEHRTLEQQPLRNDSCLPAFSRISRSGIGGYTLVWSCFRWHFFLFPLWLLRPFRVSILIELLLIPGRDYLFRSNTSVLRYRCAHRS